MNEALAHERLIGVLEVIGRMGARYERRWGRGGQPARPGLDSQLKGLIDEVRARTKFAHDLIKAMGESFLAARVDEHEEGLYGGHQFAQAASRTKVPPRWSATPSWVRGTSFCTPDGRTQALNRPWRCSQS